MKKIKFVCLLGLWICCCSCQETFKYPDDGEASALRNGKQWSPKNVFAYLTKLNDPSKYNYVFIRHLKKARVDEHLTFAGYPLEVGSYPVRYFTAEENGTYSTIVGGDAGEDNLPLWESGVDAKNPNESVNPLENYFEITSIEGNVVKGKFQVTFVENEEFPITNENLEDTIRFTQGEFTVRLPEE